MEVDKLELQIYSRNFPEHLVLVVTSRRLKKLQAKKNMFVEVCMHTNFVSALILSRF